MAAKKARGKQMPLLDVGLAIEPEAQVKRIRHPIWTENKARLIARYLYYFVLVTKHGTYIDGFAGPQEPDKPEMWAAKLVLESRPRWLRNFYLFEEAPDKIRLLEELRDAQPPPDRNRGEPKRVVCIERGDSNALIVRLLGTNVIKQKG